MKKRFYERVRMDCTAVYTDILTESPVVNVNGAGDDNAVSDIDWFFA